MTKRGVAIRDHVSGSSFVAGASTPPASKEDRMNNVLRNYS
jgi:hypothetical protein